MEKNEMKKSKMYANKQTTKSTNTRIYKRRLFYKQRQRTNQRANILCRCTCVTGNTFHHLCSRTYFLVYYFHTTSSPPPHSLKLSCVVWMLLNIIVCSMMLSIAHFMCVSNMCGTDTSDSIFKLFVWFAYLCINKESGGDLFCVWYFGTFCWNWEWNTWKWENECLMRW